MTGNAMPASPLTCELLLQIFDAPVSFHRCLVPISGSVTAALMLSQAIWTTHTLEAAGDGWFCKSQEMWMEETGLSRWELESARRSLRRAGLLEERRGGLPAKLWYRVSQDRIGLALREQAKLRAGCG
jgi:hypothetical protein